MAYGVTPAPPYSGVFLGSSVERPILLAFIFEAGDGCVMFERELRLRKVRSGVHVFRLGTGTGDAAQDAPRCHRAGRL